MSTVIRVAIIGAASLGRQMAAHFESSPGHQVVGFLDDALEAGSEAHGHRLLGRIGDAVSLHAGGAFDALQIGVGEQHLPLRERLWKELGGQVPFASFVAPDVAIDPSARVGEGCFVFPGCTLHQRVELGPLCVLQVGCIVAHDTSLGLGCFAGPGVTLAGFVQVGAGCLLGVGSTVLPECRLMEGAALAGGAVLTGDAGPGGVYVGVPARLRDEGRS